MKPPVKKKLLWINICLVLAVLLLCPAVVNKGSGDGLLLWFTVVLPALFPFMVFSGVMMKIGATQTIGHYLYPVFHHLLGLSENGCYAMAVGFLSGYPLGGKTAADLLRQNAVTPAEAQYILCFCNNASPMFLLEYIGVYCLGMRKPWLVLMVVYGTAVWNAVLFLQKNTKDSYQIRQNVVECSYDKGKHPAVMNALDEAIMDSFVTVTKVGGYIILFSILAEFVEKIVPCHAFAKMIGLGIIEITTGGEYLKTYPMMADFKWIFACGFSAFGGFSSVAQTYSVLQGTELSVAGYLKAKLTHVFLAVLTAVFLILIRNYFGM